MSLLVLAATAAAALTVAYGWLRLVRLIPLERLNREEARRSEALTALAADLLSSRCAPESPERLALLLDAGVDRLCLAFPGLSLALWRRDSSSGGAQLLVARRGGLASLEPEALRLDEGFWERAFADPPAGDRAIPRGSAASDALGAADRAIPRGSAASDALGAADRAIPRGSAASESGGAGDRAGSLPEPAAAAWRACGFGALRAWGWGTPGKVSGLLVAASADPSGAALERVAAALGLVAAHFGGLADGAWELWEAQRAREQLAGGLSLTQRRLDETHLQLMERAKRMESLEQITDAIAAHADFAPGRPTERYREEVPPPMPWERPTERYREEVPPPSPGERPVPEAPGAGRPAEAGDLAAIVAMVAKALEADLCAFLLHDEAAGELVTAPGGYGLAGDEGALYRLPLANEGASSVRVFLSGEPFITGDAQSDPRVITRYAKLWKCHSLLVVPLRIGGRRLGVLRVGSFKKDFFSGEHLRFVAVIAEEAAVLVEGALLSRRLAESNRELERLHRLKDDFISTVSHEFKTPLTSIRGFLSVILDDEAGPLTADQRRFLGLCKGSAERLGGLVQELLDLSRLEDAAIELESVALAEVAREAMERHSWEAERRGVKLELDVASAEGRARGSPAWLGRIFDNLISNALKFTPAQGRVGVSVRLNGSEVEGAVSDTGVGIPPDEQQRLFQKFFRGSDRGGMNPHGSGLGLAICKTAVEKHGGRMWVESEPGKGSRFAFAVPALGAGQQTQGAGSRAQGGGSNG